MQIITIQLYYPTLTSLSFTHVVKEVYMKKTEREQNWIETKLESKGKRKLYMKKKGAVQYVQAADAL